MAQRPGVNYRPAEAQDASRRDNAGGTFLPLSFLDVGSKDIRGHQGPTNKKYPNYYFDFVVVFPGKLDDEEGRVTRQLVKKLLQDEMSTQQKIEKRREIIQVLRDAGFQIIKTRSRDKEEIYIRLGASETWLQEQAERTKFMKDLVDKLQPKISGDPNWLQSEPFTRAGLSQGRYVRGDNGSAFTSGERIRLVETALESPRSMGGCEIPFGELVEKKCVLKYFPLHEEERRRELLKDFAGKWWWPWQRNVPLNKVRDYFGEQVAMYFSFLMSYTRWLFSVMIVSIIVAVFQFTDKWPPVDVRDPDTGIVTKKVLKSYDGPAISFYCIFLSIAAAYFLEHWKRNENTNTFIWDQHELDKKIIPRPEFEGEEKVGFYSPDMDWVELEGRPEFPDIKRKYKETQYTTRFAPKRWAWVAAAYSVGTTALLVVVIAALSLLFFREYLYFSDEKRGPLLASVIAGPAFAVTIRVLDFVYFRLARYITDKENHLYYSHYEAALIRKVFVFQFVNNYIAYYYIAFYKNFKLELLGSRQTCLPVMEGAPPNCMYELQKQLSSVFVFQIVFGNIIEVLLPRVKAFIKGGGLSLDTVLSSKTEISWVEFQSRKMDIFGGLFDDYNELIIQFGYVTLFAAGFPLAAVFAFLNNVLEVRTDAFKFLSSFQRPYIRGAKNIGMWYTVLEIQSNIAIVTNVLILCFVSTTIDELFVQIGASGSRFWKLFAVVCIEHLVFGVKLWIARAIPDTTSRVRKEIALRKAQTRWDKDLAHERALLASGKRPAIFTLFSGPSGAPSKFSSGYNSPSTDQD
eukprot:tig00001302_g8087.t1